MDNLTPHLLQPLVPADTRDSKGCPGMEQPPVPAEVADLEAALGLVTIAVKLMSLGNINAGFRVICRAKTVLEESVESKRSQSATGGNDDSATNG